MKLFKRFFGNNPASQSGVSLITTMFMLLLVSMFTVGGIALYKVWNEYGLAADTAEDMAEIQKALHQYVTENGHYPCPASLTAALDTATFGIASAPNCQTAAEAPGTFRTTGRDGRTVRTGAVPVRTLSLADRYMFDPYGKRYVYSVTEQYAVAGTIVNGDFGAIRIVDPTGRDSTSTPENIVHALFSMGQDNNGAYSLTGALLQNCDRGAASGENCDFILREDSTFTNTLTKSYNVANLFTHKVEYSTAMTPPCEAGGPSPFKDVAFLLDTSQSMMEDPGQDYCPVGMEGCSRMDLARWAMRRVLPSRIYNNQDMTGVGRTLFTGFVDNRNGSSPRDIAEIGSIMGNPVFNDPNAPGYVPPTEAQVSRDLESKLDGMCPNDYTPLGNHIEVLAEKLGATPDTAEQPNKIIIISDGESNRGKNPLVAARQMKAKYPNLQIDIIDLVGNDSMKDVAAATGGKYFRTNNPAELLQQFESSMQMCRTRAPATPPVDRPGCGSGGNWGR